MNDLIKIEVRKCCWGSLRVQSDLDFGLSLTISSLWPDKGFSFCQSSIFPLDLFFEIYDYLLRHLAKVFIQSILNNLLHLVLSETLRVFGNDRLNSHRAALTTPLLVGTYNERVLHAEHTWVHLLDWTMRRALNPSIISSMNGEAWLSNEILRGALVV